MTEICVIVSLTRSFAVTGPKCWNELPVGLRDLSVGPETFARHLKTHLFRIVSIFLIRHALWSLYHILWGASQCVRLMIIIITRVHIINILLIVSTTSAYSQW